MVACPPAAGLADDTRGRRHPNFAFVGRKINRAISETTGDLPPVTPLLLSQRLRSQHRIRPPTPSCPRDPLDIPLLKRRPPWIARGGAPAGVPLAGNRKTEPLVALELAFHLCYLRHCDPLIVELLVLGSIYHAGYSRLFCHRKSNFGPAELASRTGDHARNGNKWRSCSSRNPSRDPQPVGGDDDPTCAQCAVAYPSCSLM